MTSFSIPRPGRFEVTRPTLLARLAEPLNAQVILLAAPSGYGKSTLLAQYARSTPRACVWCRLTETHVHPLDVAVLIARAAERHVGALPHLLSPDPRTPESALIEALAQAFLNASVNLDVIVDSADDDRIARWLIQLALALGEGHRVLISRYSADGLRLARAVADGQAVILDATDLRLDEAETRSLLEARGVTLDDGLLERLQGWPAGLALSAAGSQRHVSTEDLVRDSLDSLPPAVRRTLPEVSVLDVWSEDDARQVGAHLPDGWLADVQRSGLLLLPLGQQQFQPHRLLRDLLEQDLRRHPDRWTALTLAAARLAERRGERRRAARLYASVQATAEFLHLAVPLASEFRSRGEHQLTRQLLELVPAEHLPADVRARLAWAMIETGDSARGEAILHALRQARQLVPSGFASLAMLAGRRGDPDLQEQYAREGLALLKAGEVEPALLWPLAYASVKRGALSVANEAAETLMSWARQQGDQVRLAEAWQLQAVWYRAARDPDRLAQALREARRIYDQLGWTVRAAMISLDEAELAAQTGDIQELRQTLARIPVTLERDLHLLHARAGLLRGTLAWWDADFTPGLAELDRADRHAVSGQLRQQQEELLLRRADLLLAQGDVDAALRLLDTFSTSDPQRAAYQVLMKALITGGPPPGQQLLDAGLALRAQALLARRDPRLAPEVQRHALWPRLPLSERQFLTPAAEDVNVTRTAAPRVLLHITTLGDLTVRAGSVTVPIALAKSRELLVWLALHASGTRDEMVTALWDGSAEERHVEYFKVAVRRLRGALKNALGTDVDPLPYREGRYRLDPTFQVEVDAQLDQPTSSVPRELARQFQTFAQPFMPGSDSAWIEDLRTQYQQRAITLGLAMAAMPDADAPAVFRQVLNLDPWSDAAHQGLIQYLIEADRRAEAEQALRTYRRVLQEEFGTAPPPEFMHSVQRRGLSGS